MGMSTHIIAFIPDTDELYQKNKRVLLACLEADVTLPKEVASYFGSDYPHISTLEDKLSISLKENVHYTEYNGDSSNGFEVDLTKLPKEITKLRFVNSY